LRDKGQERLYSLSDPNWNVVAITNASGTVQERMRYDAFGKVTWLDAAFAVKAGTGFVWNRAFTGQVLDGETGLMVYRERPYTVDFGRFTSRDPVGYRAGDVSLYRYVGNRITIYFDPFGLKVFGIHFWIDEDLLSELQKQCPNYLDELRRIYDDCMKDHGCPDDDLLVSVLGVKCDTDSKKERERKGLTGFVKNPNIKIPALAFHVCPYNPPLSPISRSPNPPLGRGENYGIGINLPEIKKQPNASDCSKAVATVIAHEVQEAIQPVSPFYPQGNAHVGQNEYHWCPNV